jgi:hypothetical protein
MKYQNKFGNQNLNKIRPLGPDAAHSRTTLLDWPCGGLPSRPTPKQSLARHSPTGCRRRRTERVHTAPARMEREEWRVTAGSPAAEVHRTNYAEHEHLHAHSPGTYMMAGGSRDDGASEAATAHRRRGGSTGYNASLASGTEGKQPEGCGIAASGGGWTKAQGVKLSPVTAVGADREAAGWRFRASPGDPVQEER